MPTINLGRVSIVPKGQWSDTESYKRLDLVTYNDTAYICEVPNTNVIPSETAPEWTVLVDAMKVRQATQQEVTDGDDVDAYVPPDLLQQKIDDIPSPLQFNKKSDYDKPALEFDGATLQASQQFYVVINDAKVTIGSGETVTLPTLSNATDYKVYVAADGTLSAQEYDTSAPANSALVGGFHAAYSDASIVERSLWDFAWKPTTGSPRAMALSLSERIWADIYLMDIDYGINGHSRPDAQIADDGSAPKRPIVYGGDGSATYSSFTQYIAKEMAASAGKRLPDYDEFADIAYGTVTGQVSGSDPVTTKHQAGLRSAIGLEQATGAMWQWGQENWDRGNGSSGYAWYAADTDGAGQVQTSGSSGVGASILGGNWDQSGISGSRCSTWSGEPWDSSTSISGRGVCDHKKHA